MQWWMHATHALRVGGGGTAAGRAGHQPVGAGALGHVRAAAHLAAGGEGNQRHGGRRGLQEVRAAAFHRVRGLGQTSSEVYYRCKGIEQKATKSPTLIESWGWHYSLDALIDATVPSAIRLKKPMTLGQYTEAQTESQFLAQFKVSPADGCPHVAHRATRAVQARRQRCT
jgi:hypothetical protein